MSKEVFDKIAAGWYNFRHWSIFTSELETLARRWKEGSLLNIGCAHGPDFLPFRQGFSLHGVDFSRRMLTLARKYSRKFDFAVNLCQADAGYLPYRDGVFDWAVSIATYHHIRGRDEQCRALSELTRVLKPGGEAFITVWNRWQPRFWFRSKELDVPWRTGGNVLPRYYYLFSYLDLERLVKGSGLMVLMSFPESSYRFPIKFFSRNICLLVKKPG